MTDKTVDIICPDCGEKGTFRMWTSIDLAENPLMEEKIRSGALFRYSCPHCGIITKVAYPTLIHDSKQKQMIYLAGDEETYRNTLEMYSSGGSSAAAGLLEGDYTVRLFRSVPRLAEWFRIRRAGLDDRIMELMRLFVFHEVTENNPDLEIDNLYFEESDGEEGRYLFELFRGDELIGSIGFDRAAADQMEKSFGETAEELAKGRICFDAGWAAEVFEAQGGSEEKVTTDNPTDDPEPLD